MKCTIFFSGELGRPGFPGKDGKDAPMAPPPKSRGYYFVMHSQSGEVPECPKDTYNMWEGYSLLHVYGNDQAVGQDLGQPGSCLRRFSTMPYLFCNNWWHPWNISWVFFYQYD